MTVEVGVLQIDCSTGESADDRVNRVLALIDRHGPKTDLLLLPELWNAGAFDLTLNRDIAQPIDGPLPTALAAKAREHGIWLHGGSFCERDGDSLFNTSVLFNPLGELVTTYRKVHVFTYAGEHETMTPGDRYTLVQTPLGLTGLATCYDLRFPEMFRDMQLAGAQAFLIPSGWPVPRISQWNALLPARAVETQAWVIACNQVGQQGTYTLGGHSAIIDPLGGVLAAGGSEAEFLEARIDLDIGIKWRRDFPATQDIVTIPTERVN